MKSIDKSNIATQKQDFWDSRLIKKYNRSGPRYTSYPTALQFSESVDLVDINAQIERLTSSPQPLSLYLHIPFCAHLCYYCGCNKIATRRRDTVTDYLLHLYSEINSQGLGIGRQRMVQQMHWGGGTPTFLDHREITELMAHLRACFHLLDSDSADYSIEIDPRECDAEKLNLLRDEGFNRISLGVQDIELRVQKAVNRVQPYELVENIVAQARDRQFKSINVDLIYGLPLQTADSFSHTLEHIIDLSPDRLSVFNYAHLPERFTPQQRINSADLPSPAEKLDILRNTICQLQRAGYVYIGMDHFAKPTDELAIAQQQGQLHRNFQGYSTHKDCDLLAMGVSSISHIGPYIFQNSSNITQYNKAIDAGTSPIVKGLKVSRDDSIRHTVIMQLLCNFHLDKQSISDQLAIDFDLYFAEEIELLANFQQDQLLHMDSDSITVSATGRLLIRSICMVFDAYLCKQPLTSAYSRII